MKLQIVLPFFLSESRSFALDSGTGSKKNRNSFHCSGFSVGIVLSSRSVARQVLSPPTSLTSVFGMGTGGPSSSLTPTSSELASLTPFPPKAFSFRRELRIVSRFLLPKMKRLFHFGYLPDLTEKSRSLGFSVLRAIWSGDPCGNRTHVWGVRGPRLNLLTNGPRRRNQLHSLRFRR